jgi:hypothetical protein
MAGLQAVYSAKLMEDRFDENGEYVHKSDRTQQHKRVSDYMAYLGPIDDILIMAAFSGGAAKLATTSFKAEPSTGTEMPKPKSWTLDMHKAKSTFNENMKRSMAEHLAESPPTVGKVGAMWESRVGHDAGNASVNATKFLRRILKGL